MPRGKKKNNNINTSIDDSQTQIPPEKFVEYFSKTMFDTLQMINNNPYYTPFLSNQLMKDINISPYKPSSNDLQQWLEQPQEYEQELSRLSQYLEGVVMQYERTIYHFASNLDFNYYIYPISVVPDPKKDKEGFIAYKNAKKKSLEWLRKFRLKEQCFDATLGIMREGGKFYYLRESDEFIDLQEMPPEWCTIDGRTSLGYTYAFNMAFFLRAPQSLQSFAPEFQKWYEDFYKEWQENKNVIYYKKMPPEKSSVFLFDDTRAAVMSPLRSLFKDALDVVEYKQLLKTKSMLDTWKLIYMRVPLDKDGKPSLDYKLAAQWVAQAQASLPYGAVAFGSPLEATELKVSDNQYISVLGSMANQKFWDNAGVSSLSYGSTDGKSVAAIKSSNLTDVQFVNHIYRKFEKFINYQINLNNGKQFNFGIKIFGDSFARQEISDRYNKSATLGVCKKEYLASLGKNPEEYEMQMSDDDMYLWDTQAFIPFMTAFTQSGNSGRPEKPESQLGDAGAITKDYGTNIDKE